MLSFQRRVLYSSGLVQVIGCCLQTVEYNTFRDPVCVTESKKGSSQELEYLAESGQRDQQDVASLKVDASGAAGACLQATQITLIEGKASCSRSHRRERDSAPGGIARLPFIKGGLESAGIACIGGPGRNCMLGDTDTTAGGWYNSSQAECRLG